MQVKAKIDPKAVIGEIDPMIYGQYFEHLEDCIYPGIFEEGLRQDVIETAKELQVPLVRWPGGCFADIYNWEDGVGPRENRPSRLNWYWGGVESNHFGTDEFLSWCEQVGAKPYVNVNMGSGTLEQAIRWLDYCNGTAPTADVEKRIRNGHPEPYNVEFWGLGNETWGWWEPGHSDAEAYGKKLREWAQFFRKVDPKAKLLGVGSEGGNDPKWDRAVLRHAGEYLDYLTIHVYAHTTHLFDPDDYYSTVSNAVSMEARLKSFCETIQDARREYGIERPIHVSVDEWNIRHLDLAPGASEPQLRRGSLRTLKDALLVAGVFHGMHRHSDLVKMGCHVFFANGNAVINVIESEVVTSVIADVFRIYRKLLTGKALRVETAQSPQVNLPVRQHYLDTKMQVVDLVDISAVKTPDGQINVAIINRHKTAQAKVDLEIGNGYQMKKSKTLYADDVLAYNDLSDPHRIRFQEDRNQSNGSINCLPHSITIVEYRR